MDRNKMLLLSLAELLRAGHWLTDLNWIEANKVTFMEMYDLSTEIGEVVKGYVLAPIGIQAAVVVAATANNPQDAEILVKSLEKTALQSSDSVTI